jgi:hypothetical protein
MAGVREIVLLLDLREAPERWRAQVAFHRLDRLLGTGVVPASVPRAPTFAELLSASRDDVVRALVRDATVVRPDGKVAAAAVLVPAATKSLGILASNEEAMLRRLAEHPEAIEAAQAPAVHDYVAMLALDYIAGNVFRRAVEIRADGRMFLVDNRGVFAEHPEARSIDAGLDRLKRVLHFPRELATSLPELTPARLEAQLRQGPYEEHLVHRRPLQEVQLRAHALRTLIDARRAERGDAVLLEVPPQ